MDDERLRRLIIAHLSAADLVQFAYLHHARNHAIPPGQLLVHLVPRGPAEYNANAAKFLASGVPKDVSERVIEQFQRAHASHLQELWHDLAGATPLQVHVAISYGGLSQDWR